MITTINRQVNIDVTVRVAKAGVHAADISIITLAGEVIRKETLLYKRRRSSAGVERSARKVAQNWCEMHGYSEIIREDVGDC